MGKRSVWVLLVVGLAYLGVVGCDFAYDDLIIITGNPTIDEFSFEAIGTIFSVSYWHPHLPLDNLYRPLVILTHAIEHALVGEAPLLYHLVNLCLHLLNVYLVMRILAHLLLDRRGLVLMGGLLFGLHPVLSEAVCNVTCRADMLTAGFVLMGGLLYLRADEGRERGRLSATTIAGIALCYLAALLSKENGVALIGVVGLLGMHRQPLGTGFGRAFGRTVARDWPLYLVLGGVLVLVFAVRQAVLGHSAPATVITPPELNLLPSQPYGVRFLTAVKVLGMALWKLLVPLRLTFDYGTSQIPLSRSVLDGGFLASLLVWGGLVGVAVARYREQRFPATGLLLILGSLLPMSNLILPSTSIFNERFLYLPAVGWTLLWVWGGREVLRRTHIPPGVVFGALSVVCAAYATRTVLRTFDWRDVETIVARTAEASPRSANALLDAATRAYQREDFAAYEDYLERAVAAFPESPRANYYRGIWAQEQDRAQEARSYFEVALTDRPNEWSFKAAKKLGYLHAVAGEHDRALSYYQRALAIRPDDPNVHHNLALLYQGRDQERFEYHRRQAARLR